MHTCSNLRELRTQLLEWYKAEETVALVPTMGALHRGHLALVQEARARMQRVVVSIFVNPLQFGPREDLSKYPRQLEADQKLLTDNKCDLLYTPTADVMYPAGFSSSIDPGPIAHPLEGSFRPGHFAGVATVVAKLLMQTLPTAAFFGEKDYQQLQVIRRLARDLDIPSQIIGVPIVRDDDGLALSSRNVYLSSDERQRAIALPQTLHKAKEKIIAGDDIDATRQAAIIDLTAAGFDVDYFELVHAETLVTEHNLAVPLRLIAAARLGSTRLLDNVAVNY